LGKGFKNEKRLTRRGKGKEKKGTVGTLRYLESGLKAYKKVGFRSWGGRKKLFYE